MQGPTAAYLCPPGFEGPRGLAIAREASLLLEAARLAGRSVGVRRGRHGKPFVTRVAEPLDADPVLLIPGFMAGDYTLKLMGAYLRGQGYRTYRAQIRSNSGCLAETADRLEQRIESIALRRDRPVTLVGHSLGGLLSRGLAARRPDLISGIVTMGSPLLAPSAVHRTLLLNIQVLLTLQRYGFPKVMGADCTAGECAQSMWDEAQRPFPEGLAFTSVYSRRDGIMDWRACLDPAATSVEVPTSHIGMAIDPVVFDVVTDALADLLAQKRREGIRSA
ncbi:MAG TPA: alpha/beta fold hydrolase [Nocardioidaceae bacterium]|nr:alpha/beta fold hydrolase [Nocardioidaceae bacterium]